jgi:hypothetical protein
MLGNGLSHSLKYGQSYRKSDPRPKLTLASMIASTGIFDSGAPGLASEYSLSNLVVYRIPLVGCYIFHIFLLFLRFK